MLAQDRVALKLACKMGRYGLDTGLANAAEGHALMLGFDEDGNAASGQALVDRLADLLGQRFLRLQPARAGVYNSSEPRQADETVVGQIGDAGGALERRHMVLAKALDANAGQDNRLAVGAGEINVVIRQPCRRVLIVATEILFVGLDDAARRIVEACAIRILAGPRNQGADSGFSLLAGWPWERRIPC